MEELDQSRIVILTQQNNRLVFSRVTSFFSKKIIFLLQSPSSSPAPSFLVMVQSSNYVINIGKEQKTDNISKTLSGTCDFKASVQELSASYLLS